MKCSSLKNLALHDTHIRKQTSVGGDPLISDTFSDRDRLIFIASCHQKVGGGKRVIIKHKGCKTRMFQSENYHHLLEIQMF